MRRTLRVAAAATALVLAASADAPAADTLLGRARLDGQFLLAGRVIKAVRVRGEHVGQKALRTWTFTALCATGQCSSVKLVRERSAGTDTLTLKRISPGYYEGNGKFFVPLRCGGTVYRRGESVPFTIQVRVRAAQVVGGFAAATRITATYTNRSRRNLTPCVAFPGHDKAYYHGHVVQPSGGAGAEADAAASGSPAAGL
jgi:hypothetical protein